MLRTLLWLALLGAGIYIGLLFARPQIRAWRFKDAMAQTARFADATDRRERAIHSSVMAAAEDLGVPLQPRRLQVFHDRSGDVHISAVWEEPVVVPLWALGEWVDTFHFAYEVPEPKP